MSHAQRRAIPLRGSGGGPMTAALAVPAAQVCAFALGCAVIHAARGHAEILTRVLAAAAILAAVLVLLVASLDCAPEADAVMGPSAVSAAS